MKHGGGASHAGTQISEEILTPLTGHKDAVLGVPKVGGGWEWLLQLGARDHWWGASAGNSKRYSLPVLQAPSWALLAESNSFCQLPKETGHFRSKAEHRKTDLELRQ